MKRTNQKVIPITSAYRHYARPYPNAASSQFFLDKLVNCALSVATGMGCVTILFFLLTL